MVTAIGHVIRPRIRIKIDKWEYYLIWKEKKKWHSSAGKVLFDLSTNDERTKKCSPTIAYN